jgi:multiple antibiotic resistance protein
MEGWMTDLMANFMNFLALLFIVNPINGAMLFMEMTTGYGPTRRNRTALTASLWVASILIFFLLTGKFLFKLFHFTLPAFQIAGGVLIFSTARGMTRAQPPLEKSTPDETLSAQRQEEIGIVPLAMPMLAGPGAISTIILQAGEIKNFALQLPFMCLSVLLTSAIVWIILRQSSWLMKLMGPNHLKVAMRLMGLVTMAIGVQFVLNGVTGFLMQLKTSVGSIQFF